MATIIHGFYQKNRAELPREKVAYDRLAGTGKEYEDDEVEGGSIE